MLTLGYLREKKRLMEEPKMAKSKDSVHIRGVFRLTKE
jgi:hypothetical protein